MADIKKIKIGNTSYNIKDTVSGYTTNVGTVTSVNNTSPDNNGNVSLTIPTVNNATLTITQGGVLKGTFTANASSDTTIALDTGGGGGTATDVQINGTSITSNNVANIITNTAYNASSNKIATMTDLSGKMDTDLSNMSASQTSKNTIVGWGFPDYSAGVAKVTGTTFTVTSYCLLEVRATYSGGGSQGVTVKINDKSFDPTTPGYTSNYSYYSLSPNDEVLVTYNIASNTTCTVTVYPLKGVS